MEPRSVSERLTMDLSLGWGHSDLGQRAIAKAKRRESGGLCSMPVLQGVAARSLERGGGLLG